MLKRINCAAADLLPLLGGVHCKAGLMIGFALVRRDVSIDPATFNKEKLDELIADGKFIGTLKYYNAENNNQEAQFATSTLGERTKNIDGIKGWTFIFDKGNCFQNELNKVDGSDVWAIIPILQGGKAVFRIKNDGKLSGFDAKLFNNIFDLPLTADVTGAGLQIDLTYSATQQWQSKSVVFESTDFDFEEVTPIAGVNISIESVLTASDTTIGVKVTGMCSGADIIGLLSADNWGIEVDGVISVPTTVAYSTTTKTYTLTVSALVAGKNVRLLLTKDGQDVYVLDSVYYAGSSNTEIVA